MVTIERGVLERLRHYRPSELLELQRETPNAGGAMRRPAGFDQVHRQGVAQKLENPIIGGEPIRPRFLDRLRYQSPIVLCRTGRGQISAIGREMQDVELKRLSQAVSGIVPG